MVHCMSLIAHAITAHITEAEGCVGGGRGIFLSPPNNF